MPSIHSLGYNPVVISLELQVVLALFTVQSFASVTTVSSLPPRCSLMPLPRLVPLTLLLFSSALQVVVPALAAPPLNLNPYSVILGGGTSCGGPGLVVVGCAPPASTSANPSLCANVAPPGYLGPIIPMQRTDSTAPCYDGTPCAGNQISDGLGGCVCPTGMTDPDGDGVCEPLPPCPGNQVRDSLGVCVCDTIVTPHGPVNMTDPDGDGVCEPPPCVGHIHTYITSYSGSGLQ